jgi:hypothetical protein
MKQLTVRLIAWLPIVMLLISADANAGWPTSSRVDKDVSKYWKKTWPDLELTHVTKKTDCEKAELEDAAYKKKTGKIRMLKACLIKIDAFVAKGYRYHIYRDTYVYYVKKRLRSVQLGEIEKAWKAGGVPAPTNEEVTQMLKDLAKEMFAASNVEVTIHEMGIPRPYGEFYRLTLAHDLTYEKDGKKEKRDKLFSTLQSDGTDWKTVRELSF